MKLKKKYKAGMKKDGRENLKGKTCLRIFRKCKTKIEEEMIYDNDYNSRLLL